MSLTINNTDYDFKIQLAIYELRESIEGVRTKQEMVSEGSNLLIVSDGTAFTTRAYCNGEEIKNIAAISIKNIVPDEVLEATITIFKPRLRMRVKPTCEEIVV